MVNGKTATQGVGEIPASKGLPDVTLILRRIEKELLEGNEPEKWRRMLANSRLWSQINPREQLQWANLAQIAGEADTALAIYAHINQLDPSLESAWKERLDTLSILGRFKELAAALAVARQHVDSAKYQSWLKQYQKVQTEDDPSDLRSASVPFDNFRNHQRRLELFLSLFSGREDCFARQWVNKEEGKQGYVPVKQTLSLHDLEDHLSGRKTYGIYLLRADSQVKVAVIDMDLKSRFRGKLNAEEKKSVRREQTYLISRIRELSQENGLQPLIEFSGGKGFHFWFFFTAPVDAGFAKEVLSMIVKNIAPDITTFALEVFPKQNQLSGKGLGNLVKLPLGVHRLSGKRSFFVACQDHSNEAQLDFLANIRPAEPDTIKSSIAKDTSKIFVHPRYRKWAETYPELYELESHCPPLAHLMAACRSGEAITLREEKVLYQTVGFTARGKTLMHYLMGLLPEYNPHAVDYRLSRLRGTPLGCRRIHALLNYNGDYCPLEAPEAYRHPLLHLPGQSRAVEAKSERAENLASSLDNLKAAIDQVRRYIV